jgi:hypothetical protein
VTILTPGQQGAAKLGMGMTLLFSLVLPGLASGTAVGDSNASLSGPGILYRSLPREPSCSSAPAAVRVTGPQDASPSVREESLGHALSSLAEVTRHPLARLVQVR